MTMGQALTSKLSKVESDTVLPKGCAGRSGWEPYILYGRSSSGTEDMRKSLTDSIYIHQFVLLVLVSW